MNKSAVNNTQNAYHRGLAVEQKVKAYLIAQGLVFKDEIYKDISVGDRLKGIVKKIRSGNKLDISLSQIGYRNIEPNAQFVLTELEDNNGFLPLNDKSSPEDIKDAMQMSKKSFKKAIGSLYKERQIEIKEDGIYLK